MLMLNFGFPRVMRQQQQHLWQKFEFGVVAGKTAVIVGLGHIGQKVAQQAKHLGLNVIGVSRSGNPIVGIERVVKSNQLEEVLPQADFLFLHVPLTDQTRHLIGQEAFALMPNSAFLINAARGGVVDEAAMMAALKDGYIAGAYADVFAQEPLPAESPLWETPNLVISPHIADTIFGLAGRLCQLFWR